MPRLINARAVGLTLAGSALLLGLGTGVASAHVTVTAPGATKGGGDQQITFRVPVEKDNANTVKLTVALPIDTPIASVDVLPVVGWTHTEKTVTLQKPIVTDDGNINQAVSQITWTATNGGLKPGEYGEFTFIAGQLPDSNQLTFPALQTYSDGTVVKWNQTAAAGSTEEPESPAPSLTLAGTTTGPGTAPTTTKPATTVSTTVVKKNNTTLDYAALTVGLAGFVFGALGVLLALRRRREILVAEVSSTQAAGQPTTTAR